MRIAEIIQKLELKKLLEQRASKIRKFILWKKVAFCSECGSEVFVPDLRDENLELMDKAYRKSEELISVSEIKEILDKYDIGKRPLSQLLGWGETTLTRFVSGDIPSKAYSDMLKMINESANQYLEFLKKNKDKITLVAFNKSYAAAYKLKDTVKIGDIENKIESASNYIISRSIEITPLALQKQLYFTQGFHNAFTGKFMFEEDCEAWVHGPVYRNIYNKYKDHGYNPIVDSRANFENYDLTEIEIEVLDAVIRYFGCYSGKILERITHVEPPWKQTRIGLSDDVNTERIIEKELIREYFKQVYEKYNMINVADINDYAVDMFMKTRN